MPGPGQRPTAWPSSPPSCAAPRGPAPPTDAAVAEGGFQGAVQPAQAGEDDDLLAGGLDRLDDLQRLLDLVKVIGDGQAGQRQEIGPLQAHLVQDGFRLGRGHLVHVDRVAPRPGKVQGAMLVGAGGDVAGRPRPGPQIRSLRRISGPAAVLHFSPVVVYSYLQVFSPARVATWCAFEVPWGHTCDKYQVRTWDI